LTCLRNFQLKRTGARFSKFALGFTFLVFKKNMAEDTPQQKAASIPVPTAPPEPDLDSLLAATPQFAELFGEPKKESGKNAESTEPTQQVAEAEAAPEVPAAEPIEEPEKVEETPPEPETPEPPKESDSVQKRIDKLTAQRKSAEEKAAALEAEIAGLKAKQAEPRLPAPTASSPLANVGSIPELQKRVDLAFQVKNWAIRHLDGGEIDMGNGQTQLFSGDQVRDMLARSEDIITRHAPTQANYIVARTDFDSQARKTYPKLFQSGTPENAEYLMWLEVFPECQRYPDIALIVGDAITGRQFRAAKGQKPKVNGAQPLAAPNPAAAPRVPQSRAMTSEELTDIARDPSGPALDRFVSQLIEGARAERKK
jgi:hypothetical protein